MRTSEQLAPPVLSFSQRAENQKGSRFIGIAADSETIKLVELGRSENGIELVRREILPHGKEPGETLLDALANWSWADADGASITGRFSAQINLQRAPAKQAMLRGYRFLFGEQPATIVT